jgi:threonine/homoserine/homoserine lactone efflux protein
MLDSRLLALFLAAATLLAVTPGPGIFYVLTRTLAGESAKASCRLWAHLASD